MLFYPPECPSLDDKLFGWSACNPCSVDNHLGIFVVGPCQTHFLQRSHIFKLICNEVCVFSKILFIQQRKFFVLSVQSSRSVTSNSFCDPMDCSTPGFPVHHQLPELAQTHVHRVSDAIQTSGPLSSPSPPALNLSQHQGLLQWVTSSHQVAQALELQHQSFRGIFRTGMTHRSYSLWIGWKWKHQFFGTQLSL